MTDALWRAIEAQHALTLRQQVGAEATLELVRVLTGVIEVLTARLEDAERRIAGLEQLITIVEADS